MNKIQAVYKELVDYIDNIDRKFISPFEPVDPSIGPDSYEFEVKSYCILAHAAFEDYYEHLALHLMITSIDNFITTKKLNVVLLSLIASCGGSIDIDNDETKAEVTTYDKLRKHLEYIKMEFSKTVHMNHGTSLKDLRKILGPVAIDIKEEMKWKNSLFRLVQERHSYAHTQAIKKVLPPEDAKIYVSDCLEMAKDIKSKAERNIK